MQLKLLHTVTKTMYVGWKSLLQMYTTTANHSTTTATPSLLVKRLLLLAYYCYYSFNAMHATTNDQRKKDGTRRDTEKMQGTHCRGHLRPQDTISILSMKVYLSMRAWSYLAGDVLSEELRHIVASASLLWHLSVKLERLDLRLLVISCVQLTRFLLLCIDSRMVTSQ